MCLLDTKALEVLANSCTTQSTRTPLNLLEVPMLALVNLYNSHYIVNFAVLRLPLTCSLVGLPLQMYPKTALQTLKN